MTDRQLREFGRRFKRLFRTPDYKRMARENEISKYHQGACKMVANALKAVLGGTIYAVAEFEKNNEQPHYSDWPVHHYILRVGDLFIDNTGVYSESEVIPAVGITRDAQLRLAPVRGGKWSHAGLWEGEHLYDRRIALRLRKDARAILTDTR